MKGIVIVTNKAELKIACIEKNMTFKSLAKAIGMAYQTMSLKVNNKRQFKGSEIKAITVVLELSSERRDIIFFDNDVE